MLDLNVNDFRKKALIKFAACPEGHVFAVRKQTPGDELALSEINRAKGKILVKAQELQKKAGEELTEAETKKATDAVDSLIGDIKKLEQEELKVRAAIFNDFDDGSLSIALYNELADNEREALVNAVLADTNILPEKPEDGEAS